MAILNSINYPRILAKLIDYDADGNQLEIREQINDPAEPEGFREVSLKKHLWDAEDRLRAADLSPENDEDKPLVAVYTYDAGGERSIKYVPGRFDARYSAKEAGKADRLESMLYPSPLLSAKTLPVPENMGDKKDPKLISYTKHYYIGTERIASVIGSKRGLGAYCFSADPSVSLEAMEVKVDAAGAAVQNAFVHFGKRIILPSPFLFSSRRYNCSGVQVPEDYAAFWYHPDHLGSSSYITNLAGEITQHMEYLPFGETLIEEHLNSNNSPYKFNAKELDAETGNYYYGARYYDPKFSIWLSVDPLAEKYPSISSYAYVANNPIIYIDPDGKQIEYHKNNTSWFNFGAKLRIFAQSIFGSKETRSMIKQLKKSENVHTIIQKDGTYLGSNSQPSSLVDYNEKDLNNPIPMPDIDATDQDWTEYNNKRKVWEDNKPKDHRNGEGDGSYISIDFKTDKINREENSSIEGSYKSNKKSTLFHELFHSFRIDKGVIKDNKTEEVKATQFINRNFRNDKNRRKKYYKWDVPK